MTPNDQSLLRLHIGGVQAKAGWKILNAVPGPGVDFVGDIRNLAAFSDASCAEVYCSHVLEHVPQKEIFHTLCELNRILTSGGKISISVPDLKVLCEHYVDPALTDQQRHHVMRMIYGGQVDAYDFHYVGFNFSILAATLFKAGFSKVKQVDSLNEFDDTSSFAPYGRQISLNVIALK